MAKVTRIKASDSPRKDEQSDEPAITRKKVVVKDKKQEKNTRKEIKKAEREVSVEKSTRTKEKKPFILIRPFVALFRYLRDAWHELRQVRWPNRKATWKMVLAVLVYTAIFMVFISLLDLLFSWLFNTILTK